MILSQYVSFASQQLDQLKLIWVRYKNICNTLIKIISGEQTPYRCTLLLDVYIRHTEIIQYFDYIIMAGHYFKTI